MSEGRVCLSCVCVLDPSRTDSATCNDGRRTATTANTYTVRHWKQWLALRRVDYLHPESSTLRIREHGRGREIYQGICLRSSMRQMSD